MRERRAPPPNRRAHLLMLGAWCASFALSSCLKLNSDYGYPSEAQAPRDEVESQSTGDLSQDSVSTQKQANDATASSEQQGSQNSTSPASLDSSTSSDSNSSNSSSSSSTSSEVPPTEPGPGSRWIPITVQNPSSNRDAQAGTSLSITINHQDFVSNGSSPTGDDLRIYSVRNGVRTQLHRCLGPTARWNRTDTKLWFTLDEELAPSQSETDVYHLVIDPNTNTPLQDPQQVFLVYDTFDDAATSLNNWTTVTQGAGGTFGTEVINGQLVLTAASTNSNTARRGVRNERSFLAPGVVVETSMGYDISGTQDNCTEESMLGLWSSSDDYRRAVWKRRDSTWFFLNRTSSQTVRFQIMSSQPVQGSLRRYEAIWTENSVAMYVDGQFADVMAPEQTGFTSPNDGHLQVGFSVQADGSICGRTSRVFVDWVLARKVNSVFGIDTELRTADEFVEP